MENGIAIPHIREPKKCPISDTLIVLGICKNGMDFDSLDSKKTHLFFLICTNSEIVHLKILAKIALITKRSDLVSSLISSKNKNEILTNLLKVERSVAISS